MKSKNILVVLIWIIPASIFAQFNFVESTQQFGSSSYGGVAVGDLDNDGDLDLFFTNLEKANQVWINDGKGNFSQLSQSFAVDSSYRAALADVDKDGDLDVIVTNQLTDKLYLNNGSGVFTFKQGFNQYDTSGLAIGDVNSDGYPDIVFANFHNNGKAAPNELWLNDGTGNFIKKQEMMSSFSRDAKLADFDGDGDPDIFYVNHLLASGTTFARNPPDEIWLNDGSGNFTNSGLKLGNACGSRADTGDVDGDGDMDVVVANKENPNDIWLNDGKGNFSKSTCNIESYSNDVKLSDIDDDGDVDALFAFGENDANYALKGVTIWLNDGKGVFSKSTTKLGTNKSWQIAFGDFDGDGDKDGVVANNGINKIYIKNSGNTGIDYAFSGYENDFSAFPNPAKDKIILSLGNISIPKATVETYSSQGILMSSDVHHNMSSTTLDLRNYPAGMYFVKVIADGKKYYSKILKD